MRKTPRKTTAAETNAQRVATRERVRRFRERRRARIVVVTVDIDDAILAYLEAGSQVDIRVLRRDRTQLAEAVRRALMHGTRCWQETGRLDWRSLVTRPVTR